VGATHQGMDLLIMKSSEVIERTADTKKPAPADHIRKRKDKAIPECRSCLCRIVGFVVDLPKGKQQPHAKQF
jgi:hypothetical protein